MDDLQALIDDLRDEEHRLVLTRFTNDDAIALGMSLVETGRASSLPITVDVRKGAQQVFHAALDGTSADNDAWVERKARAVERFHRSSYRLGVELRASGRTLSQAYLVDETQFAAHGGGFPLRVDGVGLVGVVTVSGLPQVDDHRLVVAALTAFLGA